VNAEANIPTSSAAGGSVSLRNIPRALLIVVPFFGLAGVGVGYTDLNIYQQKFVDVLGCGCEPSFNTNDLTTCVGFTAMGLSLSAWWLAASGLPWKARLALTCAEALALFFGFFVAFVRYNLWL
jgi:hypothetical protein